MSRKPHGISLIPAQVPAVNTSGMMPEERRALAREYGRLAVDLHNSAAAMERKAGQARAVASEDGLMDGPASVRRYWRKHVATAAWFDPDRIQVVVLMTDYARRVVGIYHAIQGTETQIMWRTPTFFRQAVMHNAAALVVVKSKPSEEIGGDSDLYLAEKLKAAAAVIQMEILDFIVMTPKQCRSVKERRAVRMS